MSSGPRGPVQLSGLEEAEAEVEADALFDGGMMLLL
jgi:hypothetical protein